MTIGDWLKINGEAIYGSSTWEVFGEGPTKQEKSGMFLDKLTYTAQDIRYTQKGNNIYAIELGWPGNNTEICLKSFSKDNLKEQPIIESISLLGYEGAIDFELKESGLFIKTPVEEINPNAIVFKILTKK